MGRHGSLAQLVEQLTFNQLVAGSNPARPTILLHEESKLMWAISSVGRAPALQAGGHWFEPGIAHHSLNVFGLGFPNHFSKTYVVGVFDRLRIFRKCISSENIAL